MVAHMLGIRLYRDQVSVALRCYASMTGAAGRYLLLIVPALALLALPTVWLYGEMAARLDRVAPARGEALLLTARFRPGAPLDAVRLDLPPSVGLTAPAVHIPQTNEVTWRLQADACGTFQIAVVAGASRATARVDACDSLQRLRGGTVLPAGGDVQSLTVDYPERRLTLAGHDFAWETPFLLLTAIFALLLKPVTGAQF
jgi:hypothetical protein